MTNNIPRQISSYDMLDKLGRVRLSEHFFMREMLYSEISNFHGISNFPEEPELAVEAGTHLCQNLLEPLRKTFGHVTVRSAYRSPTVNKFGNENKLNCSSNEKSAADHIWDLRDKNGNMGACATIFIPAFADNLDKYNGCWSDLAWWIHDHLPYHSQFYFSQKGHLNLAWRENPQRWIKTYVKALKPRRVGKPTNALVKGDNDLWGRDKQNEYQWFEKLR